MDERKKNSRKNQNQNEKKQDRSQSTGKRGTTYRDPDSPPNDHIQKDPDETYGDTKIPHRDSR
jgi:hypothetical protein